jgi:transketolase
MNVEAIDRWHKTKQGHLAFGLIELGLSYAFATLSIDSGNLIEYAATLLFFIGAIQNFIRIFITPKNERKRN